MVKETAEVIKEFNEVVNMSASELKSWIETDESKGSGWTGDGNAGGETVGHESATKIIKILEGNPKKEESEYSEEDVAHMRKVVAYCARHLAQEGKMVDEKGEEELKQTKSYKSLKNWGHDSLKAKKGGSSQASKKGDEQEEKTEQPTESAKDDKESADEEKDEKAGSSKAEPETGDKRKADEQGVEESRSEETGKDEQAQPDSKKQKEEHHDTSKQQDDGGHSAPPDSTTKQSNGSDKKQGGKAQASASSSPPSQGSKRSTRSSAK